MNASFPAAMGNRWVAVMRVYDAILGCLNQAVPGGLAAAGAGQAGIISVSAVGPAHWAAPCERGGAVHRRQRRANGADGIDGIDQPVAFLRSAPVETVELETDLLVRRFSYEPGSAAPGRHRGGLGMRIELENRGLPATVDRARPWTGSGSSPGAWPAAQCGRSGAATLSCRASAEREIGRIDVLEVAARGGLRMVTPSGGGFGDPFARDPALRHRRIARRPAHANASARVLRRARSTRRMGSTPPRPRRCAGSSAGLQQALHSARSGRPWMHAGPRSCRAALAKTVMEAPAQVRSFLLEAIVSELEGEGGEITQARVEQAVRGRLEEHAAD